MNKELIKYQKYECEDWQEVKKLVKAIDDVGKICQGII